MARPPQGWHPEDIKAALRKKYGPISQISRNWGFNQAAISKTLRCVSESVSVERRIALALGVTPQVLWPDRWDECGKPLPRSSKAKGNAASPNNARQKRKAA